MREALARTDHDFYLAEEPEDAPRRARPRSRAVAVAEPARRLPRPAIPHVRLPPFIARLARRPLRTLVGLGFTALMVGIVVNALVLQRGPHPAPLFGRGQPAPRVTAIPVPPPRPAALDAPQAEAAPVQQPASVPAPAARPAPAHEGDPLGALIRSNGTPPTASIPAPDDRVAALQRGLVKLGFAPRDTKIDGLLGSATRQAIERFEKKMNWPVTGEPSAKLARAVAGQAGNAGGGDAAAR